jgi:hypothetical protein
MENKIDYQKVVKMSKVSKFPSLGTRKYYAIRNTFPELEEQSDRFWTMMKVISFFCRRHPGHTYDDVADDVHTAMEQISEEHPYEDMLMMLSSGDPQYDFWFEVIDDYANGSCVWDSVFPRKEA